MTSLRGYLTITGYNGTQNPVFYLPTGYRPEHMETAAVIGRGPSLSVVDIVGSDGRVSVNMTQTGWWDNQDEFRLDGISFMAYR